MARAASAFLVAGALTTLIVAISVERNGQVRVHTERTTSSTTTPDAPTPFDLDAFAEALRGEGRVVSIINRESSAPAPFDVPVQVLCVDDFAIRVYEYRSEAQRVVQSGGISADGSRISTRPGTFSIPEWIAPPHFFARGRVIVLHLGSSVGLDASLTRVLGATISPGARTGGRAVDERCDGSVR
jgi:hypothetical protein